MDATYQDALRAWQQDPRDPAAYAAWVTAARRARVELPPEHDPQRQVAALAHAALHAYMRLDSAGYEHWVSWWRLPSADPGPEDVAAGIASMAEDLETNRDLFDLSPDPAGTRPGLAYPSLAVRGQERLDGPPRFGCNVLGVDAEVEETFRALEAQAQGLRVPGLRCFTLDVDYPDDGQVYWSLSYLLSLPGLDESYVLVVQFAW